jgi:ribosomal protein S14
MGTHLLLARFRRLRENKKDNNKSAKRPMIHLARKLFCIFNSFCCCANQPVEDDENLVLPRTYKTLRAMAQDESSSKLRVISLQPLQHLLLPFLSNFVFCDMPYYGTPAAANYYSPPSHTPHRQRGVRVCDTCGSVESPMVKFRLCGGCVRHHLPFLLRQL